MNEHVDLYFAIFPNTDYEEDYINVVQINRFVFHIPDDFM